MLWDRLITAAAADVERVLGEEVLIDGRQRRAIFDLTPWEKGNLVGSQPVVIFRGALEPGMKVSARGVTYECTHTAREPDGSVRGFLMEVANANATP